MNDEGGSRLAGGGCVRGCHVISTQRSLLRTPTLIDRRAVLAAGSDAGARRWLGWTSRDLVPEPRRQRMLNKRPRLRRRRLGWPPTWAPLCLAAIDPQRNAHTGMAAIDGVTPGFVPATGPATQHLPNGRIVPTAWFTRIEPDTAICPAAR